MVGNGREFKTLHPEAVMTGQREPQEFLIRTPLSYETAESLVSYFLPSKFILISHRGQILKIVLFVFQIV
jgi:hypothetical protein